MVSKTNESSGVFHPRIDKSRQREEGITTYADTLRAKEHSLQPIIKYVSNRNEGKGQHLLGFLDKTPEVTSPNSLDECICLKEGIKIKLESQRSRKIWGKKTWSSESNST